MFSSSFRTRFSGLVLLGIALIPSGCINRTKPAQISGIVTCRGESVAAGEVFFYSRERGVGASAKIDGSGKYQLATPLSAGSYEVYVMPPIVEPSGAGPANSTTATSIPKKYRDASTSGLTVTVKGGKTDFPIQMND